MKETFPLSLSYIYLWGTWQLRMGEKQGVGYKLLYWDGETCGERAAAGSEEGEM